MCLQLVIYKGNITINSHGLNKYKNNLFQIPFVSIATQFKSHALLGG